MVSGTRIRQHHHQEEEEQQQQQPAQWEWDSGGLVEKCGATRSYLRWPRSDGTERCGEFPIMATLQWKRISFRSGWRGVQRRSAAGESSTQEQQQQQQQQQQQSWSWSWSSGDDDDSGDSSAPSPVEAMTVLGDDDFGRLLADAWRRGGVGVEAFLSFHSAHATGAALPVYEADGKRAVYCAQGWNAVPAKRPRLRAAALRGRRGRRRRREDEQRRSEARPCPSAASSAAKFLTLAPTSCRGSRVMRPNGSAELRGGRNATGHAHCPRRKRLLVLLLVRAAAAVVVARFPGGIPPRLRFHRRSST